MKNLFYITILLFSSLSFAQAPGWLQTANSKIEATDANPKNLKVYEKFIEAHNEKNIKKISRMAHESILIEMPDGTELVGKEQFVEVLNNWFSTSDPKWSPFFAYTMKVTGQEGEWVIAGHRLEDKPLDLNVLDLVDIYLEKNKVRRVIVYRKEMKKS